MNAVALAPVDTLVWDANQGLGFYPVREADLPYDQAYFDKYAKMADTPMGRRLNDFRVELLEEWLPMESAFLDIGIGDGAFLRAIAARGRIGAWGYDVNPAGVAWLKSRGQFSRWDIEDWEAMTFWDSLEHIRDPAAVLERISGMAFVSIPIFLDSEHVMHSRHFRTDEHFWYFTHWGFERWAMRLGFTVIDHTRQETHLGREDIETFVLRRV
jgi:hypothetical protein